MNSSRHLLVLCFGILFSFSKVSLAAPADTTITTLNNVHQGNGSGLGTRTVVDTFFFPEDISMYSEIKLRVTLSCPTGGCDPWDRFANVSVFHEAEWYEIGRYITPYGKACGWLLDVSDYRLMLTDTVIIKSFIDTWTNPGWLVKLDFEFTLGIPVYENIQIENLWYTENLVYGDANNPSVLPVISKTIDVDALAVKFKMVNTGHGQGNTDNAAEFSQKTHSLYIDGFLANTHLLWRADCATNPCSPQSGTWQYNRAGWCPGADALPVYFDLTSVVSPGQTIDLDYRLQNYVNACSPANPGCVTGSTCADCNYNYNGHTEPHYKISGQLITYKSSNVGIKSLNNENPVLISPNPSNGIFKVQSGTNVLSGTIEIFDVIGNIVFKCQMTSEIQSVDLSGLAKGTYVLKYYSSLGSTVKRVLLQ
ncbi:MAG: T9SS type A sorting domain-containing protein [Bacteroidetes bacterium]|nr:MAG: T9SS type A sorting domain-containing protein [Bacteroidota bacterium]